MRENKPFGGLLVSQQGMRVDKRRDRTFGEEFDIMGFSPSAQKIFEKKQERVRKKGTPFFYKFPNCTMLTLELFF